MENRNAAQAGFTMVELAIVVAIITILAMIAIPAYFDMQHRAKRAELPTNVDGIKTSELAFNAANDTFIEEASFIPSTVVDKTQQDWTSSNFDSLGWSPNGAVRGAYKVVSVGATDFLVTGKSDVDDDGDEATYTASRTVDTTLVTGKDTY